MRTTILLTFCLIWVFNASANNAEVLSYAQKKSIKSVVFDSKREYYIHLPESYQDSENLFPVIYVLFGKSDTLGTVAAISAIANDLPDIVVVGVDSSGKELMPEKLIDGDPNLEGKRFKQFFASELLPYIAANYRVADFKILSGHSNAGRYVLNQLLDDPEVFDAYFASSPSIDDNQINLKAKRTRLDLKATNTRVALTLANEGEHMETPFDELVTIFKKADTDNTRFHYKKYPEQNHASVALVSQLDNLKTLFAGWRPSWDTKLLGVSALNDHYQQLEKKFGFVTPIEPLHLLQMSFVFSRMETEEGNQKAKEVVDFTLNNYAKEVSEEFFDVIEQLHMYGHPQASLNLKETVCKSMESASQCN